MDRLQPVEIMIGVAVNDRVPSSKRRVANDRVKSRIVPQKNLRELQLPVERKEWLNAIANGCYPRLETLLPARAAELQRRDRLLARLLPCPWFPRREEGRNYRITDQVHVLEVLVCMGEQRPQVMLSDALHCFANALAFSFRFGDPVAHQHVGKRYVPPCVP